MSRRTFSLTALSGLIAAPVLAHHGYMRWDTENPIALSGWISKELDGFPHWEIDIRVDGVDWEVDVGDQFVLKKAGFKQGGKEFALRRELTVEGLRPLDKKVLRILPSRITFANGDTYELEITRS
ncbi:MAG: hypothetical protein AAF367_18655 [Pseudomonadota bacterium]